MPSNAISTHEHQQNLLRYQAEKVPLALLHAFGAIKSRNETAHARILTEEMNTETIVQKIWGLCHILRGDGVSYHEYVSELTYLLFLKIAKENSSEDTLPINHRWDDLAGHRGDDMLSFYREMLTYLGEHASEAEVRKIYAFPTTVFSHSENLRAVVDGIAKLDWHSINSDRMGEVYEGLLAKNSQDARSGAGQYFTPRPLVDCLVELLQPKTGEVIQDPAMGTGGFLISTDEHIRKHSTARKYRSNPPRYEGIEIEKGTYRIALMNSFLHQLSSHLILGDALTGDSESLAPADVILANPPFGNKSGSARAQRSDLPFATSNKQLAFLQHIVLGLKAGGRAAVVLPDNVLFEEGTGRKIRQWLMQQCDLHTILRLPTGIFYSPGVQTNVLFFTKPERAGSATENIWFYDLRHDMPRFGRKRPLLDADFDQFKIAYGDNSSGKAQRSEEGFEGRWKCYSRSDISDRDDNLNASWLGDQTQNLEDRLEPDEIIADILSYFRSAVGEIESLASEFSTAEEKRDA